MSALPSLYFLRPVTVSTDDHVHMIYHGMSSFHEREEGKIRLTRAGPSIMPITFPHDLIVTQAVREMLESSGLTGFTFLPVIKYHIIAFDHDEEDLIDDDITGEPEELLSGRPHSQEAADGLGDLWELVIHPDGVDVNRTGKNLDTRITFIPESWDGTDFFLARTTRLPCVSEKARQWFRKHLCDYVDFRTEFEFQIPKRPDV